MTFEEIRRLVIIAMFSDDLLMERFVLKGGNALDIVHRLNARASMDVDLSIEGDFGDLEDIQRRIFNVLKDRFDSAGYVIFDERFLEKPKDRSPENDPVWGGYQVAFKLLEKEKWKEIGGDKKRAQRESVVIGPNQGRKFIIDISKHEYCQGKQEYELENYTIYVYTLPMIVIEKFRAICQQMEGYTPTRTYRPRARDFYDIVCILKREDIKLSSKENLELFHNIFAAKNVPLSFLARIEETREFHRPDWDSVISSVKAVREEVGGFDVYFDSVVKEASALHSLWEIDAP